ncbi:hypothetical protein N8843_10280 [Verrucomicrobia bacterium]|nr:hypothetical protein [Verrucomicrobiota bacterium]
MTVSISFQRLAQLQCPFKTVSSGWVWIHTPLKVPIHGVMSPMPT